VDQQPEVQLARALLAGEPEAFNRFVEYFRAKVFQYSWLMCGQREDAEEVAQETLLRVFESFEQLREPEHVKSWVFRIARNACLMKRRKSVYAPAQELSLDALMPATREGGESFHIEVADWKNLPDDQLLRAELKRELDRAIASLPETYRSVVLLRDIEELSTEETAQVLDLTADVIKTRLHRGRLAIRQKLDAYLRSAGVHTRNTTKTAKKSSPCCPTISTWNCRRRRAATWKPTSPAAIPAWNSPRACARRSTCAGSTGPPRCRRRSRSRPAANSRPPGSGCWNRASPCDWGHILSCRCELVSR
jgi:RNA polymerase sigma-70 factor (ECF subfamily)